MIDLRSDTVTRPTPRMRDAMARAEVGDDVWGEDPTVRQLEAETASLLGKEAALFVPSGTMANQIAMLLHLSRGDEVLVGEHSHVVLYESGALAAWAGAQARIVGHGGLFDAHDLEVLEGLHEPRTRLVAVENTHNRAGGRVWPIAQLDRVTARARDLGLATHLDGARLWNAAVASHESPARLARGFDTVATCYSKGLGAPVGSALVGSRSAIGEARRHRKRLGGGMRQAGVLAAACLVGLEERNELERDHVHARALAKTLADVGCELDPVETNIVVFAAPGTTAHELVERAKQHGVLIAPFGRGLRAVFHRDIPREASRRACEILARVCARA